MKFYQLAAVLTREEWEEFLGMIAGGWRRLDPTTQKLAGMVAAGYPDFQTDDCGYEQLQRRLSPNGKVSKQALYDRFSYLVQALEDYLAIQQVVHNPRKRGIHLLAALRERNAINQFDKTTKKLASTILHNQPENEEILQKRFEYHAEQEWMFQEHLKEEARTQSNRLQQMMDAMDAWYAGMKYKYAAEMRNRTRILNQEYVIRGMDSLPQIMPDQSAAPFVAFYAAVYGMMTHPEEPARFAHLRELFQQQGNALDTPEIQAIYAHAENYCIRQINAGQSEALRTLFELYKERIDRKLLLRNGQISQWDYKNIVSLTIRLGEWEWAMGFANDFKAHLEDAVRENAYAYNMAALYDAAGEKGKALRLLQQVEFSDLFYNLGARSMLLRIYFEMEETEAFFSHVTAFRTFLRRSRLISDAQRKVHRNLVAYTAKLYRLRIRAYHARPETIAKQRRALRAEVEAMSDIANKSWLMSQMA